MTKGYGGPNVEGRLEATEKSKGHPLEIAS